MEIFIDSANLDEIRHWVAQGVADGVTTNPSIMLKEGLCDIERASREIAAAIGDRPLSVEVTTNEPAEMVEQGRQIASWAPNVVVKIPVITQEGRPCLAVVRALSAEGIRVNVTAILSFNQVVLAAKAGAAYLSIFAGRIADEGNDAAGVVRMAVQWAERWRQGKILVGSIRSAIDVHNAAAAGAHVITVPPPFLARMVDHKYSRETVRGFNHDAAETIREIQRRRDQRRRGNGREIRASA